MRDFCWSVSSWQTAKRPARKEGCGEKNHSEEDDRRQQKGDGTFDEPMKVKAHKEDMKAKNATAARRQ